MSKFAEFNQYVPERNGINKFDSKYRHRSTRREHSLNLPNAIIFE